VRERRGREVKRRGKRGEELWALCKSREILPFDFWVLDYMKVRERKERKGEGKERERRGKGEGERWGKGDEGK
jgi:hypothetical protein